MTIYSTLWSNDRAYNDAVEILDWRRLGEIRLLSRIMDLKREDTLIVNGAIGAQGHWRDIASVAVAFRRGRRFGVVVSDATWDPRSSREESRLPPAWSAAAALSKQLLLYIMTDRTIACFLSNVEVAAFIEDTRQPQQRAVFTPFFATAVSKGSRPRGEPYVFSGGDSLRDWRLLTEALGGCGIRVVVATHHHDRTWPPNFEVLPVDHGRFVSLASGASVGVLALRSDVRRSVGQQTYLNLLSYGVPVVVNDAPGVRDHLHGIPGAHVTPALDADAMRDLAVALAQRSAAEARETSTLSRAALARDFTQAAYLSRLVELAAELQM